MTTRVPPPVNKLLEGIKIFIVDDEEILAWSLENEFKSLGAEIQRADSVRQALVKFPQFDADVVISDIRLPDGNGLDLVKRWKTEHPDLPIILVTAHGAIDSAITALRLGAFDYFQKPFDLKSLTVAVKRAAEVKHLRSKVSQLEGYESAQLGVNIIGESEKMIQLKKDLRRLAKSHANMVLIIGESGSGKELGARAVHYWSDEAHLPFVEINCASIPENLLESELFGYERGAFTDAKERKLGLFEMAKAGTIFLDEIGEMPLKLQAKLLRVLESRRFKRLGGTKDIDFNGRIVAATNRNLLEEVAKGQFRGDLYYRIAALPVRIPPLRERAQDLPDLTKFLVQDVAATLKMTVPKVSDSALKVLADHDWPGNIRELRNVLLRALVFHEPTMLLGSHLILEKMPIFEPVPTRPSIATSKPQLSNEFVLPVKGLNLEALEKSLLEQAISVAHNNQTKAASLLGISRHTLRYRLEKYGLDQGHDAQI